MFFQIFSLYIQGLLMAIVFVVLAGGMWIFYRANRQMDKTVRERQAILYEAIMMALMTAPILSFAFMALLIMLKS